MRGDSGKPAKAAKEVNMPDTEMKWTMPGPDSTIARLLLWFQMSSHEGGDASFRLPSSLPSFCLLPGGYCILVQLQTVKRCCKYGRKCQPPSPSLAHTHLQ